MNHLVDGEIGHPALLVHDLGASFNDWEALIPCLVTTGHRTYTCELPGHGQSQTSTRARQYQTQMYVAAFRRWVESLKLIRAPILIGHGFGAYLSLRYALAHPYRVYRLILINPLLTPEQILQPARSLNRLPLLASLAWRSLPNWTRRKLLGLNKKTSTELINRVWKNYRNTFPLNRQIPASITDLTIEVETLPTRSLFIAGEDDPLFDMSLLPPLLADHLQVTLVTLPGVGHRPHLEAPEETNGLITKFLLGF